VQCIKFISNYYYSFRFKALLTDEQFANMLQNAHLFIHFWHFQTAAGCYWLLLRPPHCLLPCLTGLHFTHLIAFAALFALQEMREQFAGMLEEARLVSPHQRLQHSSSSGPSPGGHWLDDPGASCNRYAQHAAVVSVMEERAWPREFAWG
jgi:hypothetical protein